MLKNRELADKYKMLDAFTSPVKKAERAIVGREREMNAILAAFHRPELCNVILLAEAGSGKTALVQGTMLQDTSRLYLEVDLSRMIAGLKNSDELAAKLKSLFDEAAVYVKDEGEQLVLFIDEFHLITQLSAAAVEALKPLLADSGTRNIRVIAATTYEEFRKYISPNQPLVERLQRINVAQPNKEMTVKILKGMAKRYGVEEQFYNDYIFEMIYEYTNRYIPANSQPRKSILILDAMVGWYKYKHRSMDMKLLADVIYDSENVNISFRVDAKSIKTELDKRVFSQQMATDAIEERLQICVADLNDPNKPMATMLFTGSTGVGKSEMTKQLAKLLFESERNLLRFDMTEYANEDTLRRFQTELTTRVWERPYSIVLLDEIEKACAPVTRLLLQVLDDGRLTDQNGREVSFTNCYIVLTTNAASEIYKTIGEYNRDDKGSGSQMKKYMPIIKKSLSQTTGSNKFPPELVNRINCIVPFQPLSPATQKTIIKHKLAKLTEDVIKKHNVQLLIQRKVVDYLVDESLSTDSDAGGARQAVAKLEADVVSAVARYINLHPNVLRVGVSVVGDMASENKNQLESKARIEVVAAK